VDLKEARKMLLGFPETRALGDKTVKRMRTQQRMIANRQRKGLEKINEPFQKT
jgi:hypothetical protein